MTRNTHIALSIALAVTLSTATLLAAEQAGPVKHTLGKPFAAADYGGNRVALVDAEGSITWEYPAQRPQDVWVLKNGNVLFSHVKGAMIVTPEKEIAWRYDTDPKNEVQACQPLPDGMVLVAESGPMQLVEVDADGKVQKTVKLQTAIPQPHRQMRCVRKLKNGHYTVGQYYDNVVREYDADGKIVLEIPQKEAFSGIRLSNGNTLIAAGDSHLLRELDADGKVVWQVNENDLPGNPLRFIAGLQRLENGNTVICNWGGHGHVGEQAQIVEITPEKKVVGEFFDFDQFSTISGFMLLGTDADPANFEVMR